MNDIYEINVDFDLEEADQSLDFDLEADESTCMELETGIPVGGVQDYRKLKNLPSINGTTLVTNYDEIDPTVPTWAKGVKPKPMTETDIEFIWRSIFD